MGEGLQLKLQKSNFSWSTDFGKTSSMRKRVHFSSIVMHSLARRAYIGNETAQILLELGIVLVAIFVTNGLFHQVFLKCFG